MKGRIRYCGICGRPVPLFPQGPNSMPRVLMDCPKNCQGHTLAEYFAWESSQTDCPVGSVFVTKEERDYELFHAGTA